jgi:hypothetical protein
MVLMQYMHICGRFGEDCQWGKNEGERNVIHAFSIGGNWGKNKGEPKVTHAVSIGDTTNQCKALTGADFTSGNE